MVRKTGRTIGVRLDLSHQARFDAMLQRSGIKQSELARHLFEIALEAVEFLERREKKDITSAKHDLLDFLSKRQQKLPFDKA